MTEPRVPLKRVARIVAGQSPSSEDVSDIEAGRPFLQGNGEFGARHPQAKSWCDVAPKVCRSGDVLLSVRAPVGALNVAEQSYGIGRGLCAIQPVDLDPEYLWWALTSIVDDLDALATGSTYDAVSADDVGSLMLPFHDRRQQRCIADYLDVETARLDAVIATLGAANNLLSQMLSSQIESLVWSETAKLVPLMRLTCDARQIQYGIVLPGPDVDDGVPIVKGGNLLSGVLRADGLAKTTYEIEAGYGRSRLEAGDIAFAIRGAVGACAMVPPEVAGANITQDVAMIAHTGEVDPTWLLFALRSRSAQGQAEARILGATIQGINIRDLKRLKLPWVDFRVQREIAGELVHAQSHHDNLVAARTAQINLLKERRQALIAAAVSGQIEIPGVAA